MSASGGIAFSETIEYAVPMSPTSPPPPGFSFNVGSGLMERTRRTSEYTARARLDTGVMLAEQTEEVGPQGGRTLRPLSAYKPLTTDTPIQQENFC